MKEVKLFIGCYFEEVKPPPHKVILATTPLPTTLYLIFIKLIRHLWNKQKCYTKLFWRHRNLKLSFRQWPVLKEGKAVLATPSQNKKRSMTFLIFKFAILHILFCPNAPRPFSIAKL